MRRAIFVLILLVGLGVLNYPYLSTLYRQHQQMQLAQEYEQQLSQQSGQQLEQSQQYNAALTAQDQSLLDAFSQTEEEQQSEDNLLGFVESPKSEQYRPIYEGTTPDILTQGVGHLTGSSLPIGGESTHAVLAGHSGLHSQLIFTDLEQLVVGDRFTLHVLGEELVYAVDQILTVDPWETQALEIEEGRDLVTLITCVPYGVNTHRLLVRGERVETPQESKTDADQGEAPSDTEPTVVVAAAGEGRMATQKRIWWISLVVLGAAIVWALLGVRKKKTTPSHES